MSEYDTVDLLGRLLGLKKEKLPNDKSSESQEPKLSDAEIANKTPEELQSIVAATMEAEDADLRKRYEQLCDRIVAGILRAIVEKNFRTIDNNTISIDLSGGELFGFSDITLMHENESFRRSLNRRLAPKKLNVLEAMVIRGIFVPKEKQDISTSEYYKITFVKEEPASEKSSEDKSDVNQDTTGNT